MQFIRNISLLELQKIKELLKLQKFAFCKNETTFLYFYVISLAIFKISLSNLYSYKIIFIITTFICSTCQMSCHVQTLLSLSIFSKFHKIRNCFRTFRMKKFQNLRNFQNYCRLLAWFPIKKKRVELMSKTSLF